MLSTDLRGFRDALAPLRQQRGWALDRAVAALAAARLAHREACNRQREAFEELQAQALAMANAWTRRGDPTAQAGLLAYLAQLQHRHAQAEGETARRATVVADAQATVLLRERDAQALERQRQDALHNFRLEQDRKLAGQADEAWLLRCAPGDGAGE